MNPDEYESLPTTSVATNMTAGAIAGVMEHCVMYPLDSVKTRMQSLTHMHANETIISTMRDMVRSEGLLRPFRGVMAVVAGAGPAHALYFGAYEYSKETIGRFSDRDQINYMVSAALATLVHDAISNPADVVKQRLQMYNSPYSSIMHCARQVYRTEGLRAFYRSYSTQLVMNIPYSAIQFPTYEFFQKLLNEDNKYNPPVHMVAGGAAGAAASALTTPLDVCKTLLNTQEDGAGKTTGLIQAVKKIYRTAGVMGFFKGLQARVLYQMPATAICWSTYEFFKYILTEGARGAVWSSVKTPKGIFPSGWDDPDDLIQEDSDPTASLERLALWAAGEDKLEVLEHALTKKASIVSAVDSDGYTPLHKACYNNNIEMAKLLLQYGANPNARTEMGWTPLHSACKWNNAECVSLLLQHGANINAASDGDQTPLHIAATVSDSRSTLITLLMDERIKPDLLNNSGEKAADIAKKSGFTFPLFEMAQSALSVETGLLD